MTIGVNICIFSGAGTQSAFIDWAAFKVVDNKSSPASPSKRLGQRVIEELSNGALLCDPILQAYWRTHQGKEPKKILIKVAHKLLSRTHAVIKTGIPYQAGIVS